MSSKKKYKKKHHSKNKGKPTVQNDEESKDATQSEHDQSDQSEHVHSPNPRDEREGKSPRVKQPRRESKKKQTKTEPIDEPDQSESELLHPSPQSVDGDSENSVDRRERPTEEKSNKSSANHEDTHHSDEEEKDLSMNGRQKLRSKHPDFKRTPNSQFVDLPGFEYQPHYFNTSDGLRMHYIDEGPSGGLPIVLTHGLPTWSYLNRHMIPPLVEAGYRVLALDLIGFGKSDKPTNKDYYTQERMVQWFCEWIEYMDLQRATIVGQDWGGVLGLRALARFSRTGRITGFVAANSFLPTGDPNIEATLPAFFFLWKFINRWTNGLQPSSLPFARFFGYLAHQALSISRTCLFFLPLQIANWILMPFYLLAILIFGFPEGPATLINYDVVTGGHRGLSNAVKAAYNAPFPDPSYMTAVRELPELVAKPSEEASRAAWRTLHKWDHPFLTIYGKMDGITSSAQSILINHIPGSKGQDHVQIPAGHFLQESSGAELALHVRNFMIKNSKRI